MAQQSTPQVVVYVNNRNFVAAQGANLVILYDVLKI